MSGISYKLASVPVADSDQPAAALSLGLISLQWVAKGSKHRRKTKTGQTVQTITLFPTCTLCWVPAYLIFQLSEYECLVADVTGVAPVTQLRPCIMKIVPIQGKSLNWVILNFHNIRNFS